MPRYAEFPLSSNRSSRGRGGGGARMNSSFRIGAISFSMRRRFLEVSRVAHLPKGNDNTHQAPLSVHIFTFYAAFVFNICQFCLSLHRFSLYLTPLFPMLCHFYHYATFAYISQFYFGYMGDRVTLTLAGVE